MKCKCVTIFLLIWRAVSSQWLVQQFLSLFSTGKRQKNRSSKLNDFVLYSHFNRILNVVFDVLRQNDVTWKITIIYNNTQQQQNKTDWINLCFREGPSLRLSLNSNANHCEHLALFRELEKSIKWDGKKIFGKPSFDIKRFDKFVLKNAKTGFQKSYILPQNSIIGSFSSQFLNSINQTTQPILSWFKQTPLPIKTLK